MLIPLFLVLIIIFAVRSRKPQANDQIQIAGTSQSLTLDRELTFPLKDGEGNPTESFLKYTISSAALTDQIVIKGQKATAIPGRTFLILSLKLENPTQTSLSIRTRDFVRLEPEGSVDKLAPDIHNDPSEVQAISTKITRVGFPVNDGVRNFKLYVGEINGEKQVIDLNF